MLSFYFMCVEEVSRAERAGHRASRDRPIQKNFQTMRFLGAVLVISDLSSPVAVIFSEK